MARDLPGVGQGNYANANDLSGLAALQQGASGYTAQDVNNPYTTSSYGPSQFQTGSWNNAAAQQYMDPYITQVMDTVLSRQQDSFARDQNARNSRRVASGAFGGLRQGVEDAVAGQEFRRNQAEQEAGLLSNAYQQAFGAFNQDQSRDLERQRLQEGANQFGVNFNDSSNRAGADFAFRFGQLNEGNRQQQAQIGQQQAQGLGTLAQQQLDIGNTERDAYTQSIDMLRNIGLDQQRQTQASLDLGYQDFINQRDYEMQMLNFYNSMIRGMPISSNSNVIQYENSNPYSEMLGMGLGAASLYNAFGGGGGRGG